MDSKPTFHVGGIPIYGESILSPMDGVSDWPFRSLCRRLGSAMSYTEFVRAEDVLQGRASVFKRLTYDESERSVAFQIYGDEPDEIVEAALRIRDLGPDTIDLNMGCPAKSVANRGAGVGMMRTPLKIARAIRKLTAALDIPVTGKMRIGWNDCQTYKLVARIVEEEGGALIAIHGRTKEQGYGGTANWDAIAEVKAAVKIPVIGNGDVRTVADIKRMRDYTGCEAVMIGREAMANPWIFSGRDREQVPAEEVRAFMREHLRRNIEFYGEDDGQRLFRKYVAQYLMMRKLTREERRDILSKKPPEEFLAVLDEVALTLAEIRT
ncbi:MAG: tRNA-dihydrouridine synthase [Anaerolineales bacterium]|nr:tRNA-dihydrouridine synthase [Anaerolineales bacterium]